MLGRIFYLDGSYIEISEVFSRATIKGLHLDLTVEQCNLRISCSAIVDDMHEQRDKLEDNTRHELIVQQRALENMDETIAILRDEFEASQGDDEYSGIYE